MSQRTLVECQDRSGVKYFAHRVDDRTYPDYPAWHYGDYRQLLDSVKNFQVQDGDVLVTGYPKSGNTWMHEVIAMVLQQTTEYTPTPRGDNFFDDKTEQGLFNLHKMTSPRILETHLSLDSLPTQIPEKDAKVIYIVRNVKDVAVSMFYFAQKLTLFIPYKGKWEDYLELALGDGLCYGSWFDNVRQAELFRTQHPQVPFHVICYELMKTKPVEEISKLCRFLGQPDDLAAQIAQKIEFRTMVPTFLEGKYAGVMNVFCEPGAPGLFRKGEVGDWKTMFTDDQNKQVTALMDKHLAGSSIAETLKPFMDM